MTPFKKFMLQAQGRNPDLEEQLQAEKFCNIERYYKLVFGRELQSDERLIIESISSALRTTVDDEYVIQIYMAGRGLDASQKLTEEISAAKEVIVEANVQQKELYANLAARDSWLVWTCFVLVLVSLSTSIWIAGKIAHLPDRMDVIGSATKS